MPDLPYGRGRQAPKFFILRDKDIVAIFGRKIVPLRFIKRCRGMTSEKIKTLRERVGALRRYL